MMIIISTITNLQPTMKKGTRMRVLASLVIVALSVSVWATQESAAEIEGLRLEVDGLSCPFCVIGLNKHLKKRAGLEEIEVHLKQGVTEATLPEGQGIDVGKVRLAIKEAGFTLRGITLAVIGYVRRDQDQLTIESRDDGTRFVLFDAAHTEGNAAGTLSQTLFRQLEGAEAGQQLVRVSGSVHEHAGMPAGLLVEAYEEVTE